MFNRTASSYLQSPQTDLHFGNMTRDYAKQLPLAIMDAECLPSHTTKMVTVNTPETMCWTESVSPESMNTHVSTTELKKVSSHQREEYTFENICKDFVEAVSEDVNNYLPPINVNYGNQREFDEISRTNFGDSYIKLAPQATLSDIFGYHTNRYGEGNTIKPFTLSNYENVYSNPFMLNNGYFDNIIVFKIGDFKLHYTLNESNKISSYIIIRNQTYTSTRIIPIQWT